MFGIILNCFSLENEQNSIKNERILIENERISIENERVSMKSERRGGQAGFTATERRGATP